MPNWCTNSLSSENVNLTETLSKFLDEDGNIDFQKIKPCPEEFYKDGRWYSWCVVNWGTKWSSWGCSFAEDGITVRFETAWTPPLGIIQTLATLIKADLRLLYSEPGVGFQGEFVATEKGDVTDNFYSFADYIPKELEEELKDTFGSFDE